MQIDFAMAYQYEYQDEVQSALRLRCSANFFTTASIYMGETTSYLICTIDKLKGGNAVLVFVEHLYIRLCTSVEKS